jgi:hypothetical protein
MPRTELLQRLKSQDPVSAETCFVLLWTYLNQARVAAGESLSRARNIHPFRIEPHMPDGPSLRQRLSAAIRELQAQKADAFDLYALRWLKALDLLLNQRQLDQLGQDWIAGLDGVEYRVRRRNHFLAGLFPNRVTNKTDQSGTRDLYARFHIAVPKDVGGISIEIRPENEWANPLLRSRFTLEKDQLRVMLWPFQMILDYPALDPDNPPGDFISLYEIRNEEALRGEVETALATARDQRASLLIFPELSIPPRTRQEIQRWLKAQGPDGYPLLTLIGCCHRQAPEGGDFNEAFLLGPGGEELHCHPKLASFTSIVTRDRAFIMGERLRTGTTVSILEGPLGNLTPLICLDFIHKPLHQVLTRVHANLFAVPSLSHTTADHQERAKDLQGANLASSFVSNRAIEGLTAKATSFFRVPHKDGLRTHLPGNQGSPYLLFSLQDFLEMDKTGKWQVS